MFAARGVVQLVTKKSVLTIKEKMHQRPASRKNPNPAVERRTWNLLPGFRLVRD